MDSLNFLQYFIPQDKPDIKEEALDPSFSLLSPSITPSPPLHTLPCVPSTSRRRGSTSSLAGSKRPRPYPSLNRDLSSRKEELGNMSSMTYGTWSGAGARSGHSRSNPSVERRSPDGEDQPAYAIPNQFMNEPYLSSMTDRTSDLRPISSSSSLTGAMGDANIHSRLSRSPASSNSGHIYTGNVQTHDLTWNTTPHMQTNTTIAMDNSTYPGVAGHGGLSFPGMGDMSLNDYTTNRNVSPESLPPNSPQYSQGYTGAYTVQRRAQMAPQGQGSGAMDFGGSQMVSYLPSTPSPEGRNNDDEVRRLRRRVQELELECSRTRDAMESMRSSMATSSGLPTPPLSAAFQNSWRARTEARKRLFCSLNRAGNALCAWHDSRRERRAYPPRNAPPGYLNCGCTYEQALFEESLSRHGVGSYLPGETVRMDPALRNPLLKLLQERYGYKDGDFEHDPLTETWAEGESPAAWERKAQSGVVVKRRPDADRH